MKVAVIVVSYNAVGLLMDCLRSVFAQKCAYPFSVWVVDNASKDGSADRVAQTYPQVSLIRNPDNKGFAAANNQAFEKCDADYVILLNPDTVLEPDALERMAAFMEKTPSCAIAGGFLRNPAGGRDPCARHFIGPWRKLLMMTGVSARLSKFSWFNDVDYGWFAHDRPLAVDWVPGTFTCYRRSVLDTVGTFDERFFLYYEETDLCLRVRRAGWDIYFIPDAVVMHVGGGCSRTRKDEPFDRSGAQVLSFRLKAECLYYRKNFGLLMLCAAMWEEWLWHQARRVANFLPGAERAAKRAQSAQIAALLLRALKDTSYGRVCPPKPW